MQGAPPVPGQYEPAPPGRSKKRRPAAPPPEEHLRLGEQVDRASERLMRGWRPVRWSAEDKAPQITLDAAQLAASSSKGYRMVRATHGAHAGTWYYEVRVGQLGATGAVRLGWATREAELQACVGADGHGCGYRSVDGSKVHGGRREAYGQAFRQGDVIGCLLHLPPGGQAMEKSAEGEMFHNESQLYSYSYVS